MSPAERQTWRDLVANVPMLPPAAAAHAAAGAARHAKILPPKHGDKLQLTCSFKFQFARRRANLPAVHPIAFYLGSLPIRWYGVMMALAFLAGLWTATRRARLANVSGDVIADVTLWLMAGSIVGARFVYVTTYWKQEFAGQPFSEIFMIQHGGLVYYGGLIGATVAGDFLSGVEKTSGLENRRHPGAERRAGQCFRAHRLPAQRLLLRPRLQSAVGNLFSR